MNLTTLRPDHWVLYVIDGLGYVVAYLLVVVILRLSLRRVAEHEADDSLIKSCVSVLLILMISGVLANVPETQKLGVFILLPCFLLGALVLQWLCWITIKQSLVIMLIVSISVLAIGGGITGLFNVMLPKDRVTLVKKTKLSLGILAAPPIQPAKPVGKSHLLFQIKSGLKLEKEAFVTAVAILKDPSALAKMTAQHNEALAALDLLSDGKTLTPEELAQMGIDKKEQIAGYRVMKNISPTNEYTAEDVENVAAFLRAAHIGQTNVTAEDAALIMRAAMNRASTSTPTEVLATYSNALTGNTSGNIGSSPQEVASTSTNLAMPSDDIALEPEGGAGGTQSITGLTATPGLPPEPLDEDPLLALDMDKRQAWLHSKTGLVVSAVMSRSRGRSIGLAAMGIIGICQFYGQNTKRGNNTVKIQYGANPCLKQINLIMKQSSFHGGSRDEVRRG